MPIDRTTTNNTGRPLKPTLATTRTAKTPIAPRLAPSIASASSSQPGRTRGTPIAPKAPTIQQDDRTPVKPLNSNITPRSSARKSRVGFGSPSSTASGTPSGTPSSSRPCSTIEVSSKDQGSAYGGLGINGLQSAQSTNRPRSLVVGGSYHTGTPTPRPHVANVYNNNSAADAGAVRSKSPKFFHANDTRAQDAAPAEKRAPIFFYASGQQEENVSKPYIPSPPLSALGKPQQEDKFFHADSLPEPRGASPVLTPPIAPAMLDPWTGGKLAPNGPILRSPSPPKDNIHLSYRKGASQVIRPTQHNRPTALSIISGNSEAEPAQDNSRRRSSAASAVRLGHVKSASLSSIDSATPMKKTPSHDMLRHTPSPLHNQHRVVSNGSLPQSTVSSPVATGAPFPSLPSPKPQSPGGAPGGNSMLEQMNDLASNARRERKVLDLEISNSSLLAINRQLEREVRKQKAELRRFRRLSRAGRLSVESTRDAYAMSGTSELEYLTDMSEGEEQGAEEASNEEEPEYSSESSFDENIMSSTDLAQKDAEYRLRDEKRLQLDLTKHRELLVDSQRMNQSLKRCLDWTEELIKDGRKALAYQVRPSDVKLGGRVLDSQDEHELEPEEESKTLLSPWSPAHEVTDALKRLSLTSERTDHDSGVEVDGLRPGEPELPSNVSPLASPLS